jgi:epoxyqueuosine reductase
MPDRVLAAQALKEEAKRLGFLRVGIARADEPPHFGRFRDWIAGGFHARMFYLERTTEVRGRPQELLPGARSILCLADRHPTTAPVAPDGTRIARYALGSDYHQTLRERAERVAQAAARRLGPFRHRVCVDSTPIAERAFAAAAGLGWIGKNGCVIDPEQGSFLLLAEIVTDLDLPPDEPMAERCGSCVRCLDACPTQAFLEPGLLDSNRCLAYWTIEHRGPIPDAFKEQIGDHVFGCDICQEVCPWNQPIPFARVARSSEASAKENRLLPTRPEWLAMSKGEWRRRFGATALNRAGRRGVQRNAAASAGALRDVLAQDQLPAAARCGDTGLADAAAWALRRLTSPTR